MTKIYTLTIRELGGVNLPSSIKIYPKSFDYKDEVTSYLKIWNSDKNIDTPSFGLKIAVIFNSLPPFQFSLIKVSPAYLS